MSSKTGTPTPDQPSYEDLEREIRRLEGIVEAAQLGLWDWNIPSNRVLFSSRWKAMLGYQDWELKNKLDTWLNLLCPEDRDWVSAALQDHLDGKTPVYATEHRLLHKDGHWVWVLDIGRVVEGDEDGKPLRASGVHQEISERKKSWNQS